jgi:hypothetical protein
VAVPTPILRSQYYVFHLSRHFARSIDDAIQEVEAALGTALGQTPIEFCVFLQDAVDGSLKVAILSTQEIVDRSTR